MTHTHTETHTLVTSHQEVKHQRAAEAFISERPLNQNRHDSYFQSRELCRLRLLFFRDEISHESTAVSADILPLRVGLKQAAVKH